MRRLLALIHRGPPLAFAAFACISRPHQTSGRRLVAVRKAGFIERDREEPEGSGFPCLRSRPYRIDAFLARGFARIQDQSLRLGAVTGWD